MRRVFLLNVALLLIVIQGCCKQIEPETCTDQVLPSGVKQLYVPNVFQDTPVWCWLACGEMVFRYYGYPNVNPAGRYQCGIIGLTAGPNSICYYDCSQCIIPAGSYENFNYMLRSYPALVKQYVNPNVPLLDFKHLYRELQFDEIKYYIDNKSPIIAGISPSGYVGGSISQHVTVIQGYMQDSTGNYVLVNDPFPYQNTGYFRNPNIYCEQGAIKSLGSMYLLLYSKFVQSLNYHESYYDFKKL